MLALRDNTGDYGKCFILTADIDMQGQVFMTAIIAPNTCSGYDFQGTAFTGTFDGNGHKITNFTIDGGGNSCIGLFGRTNSGGSVKNLGLENCIGNGIGNGNNYQWVGGLVGYNEGTTISNCYSTGVVSGDSSSCIGGLVGENYGSISNCYSTGTVSGGSGSSNVGGLVGLNSGYSSGSISNCYSSGIVSGGSGSSNVGGLVGSSWGSISSSYFLTTSGPANGYGTPLTDAQMKQQSSFASWDFDTIWDIIEGVSYPFLREVPPSIPTLKWPFAGDIGDRQVLLGFGNIWTWSYCGGLPKKHTGVDLKATKGEYVYAPEAGTVKAVLSDSGHPEWKYCVTIKHSGFTTVCWHVEPVVNIGDSVARGQVIATIADLGANTHLHFGVRASNYSNDVSNVGALPQTDCGGYPAFPEQFVDPMTLSYEITQPLAPPEITPRPESENPQPGPLAFEASLEIFQVPVPPWYGDKSWQGVAIRILDRFIGVLFPLLKSTVVPVYPVQAQDWRGNDATAVMVAVAGTNQTQTDAIKLTEASDAFIWKEVTIPKDAYGLTFDAIFLGEPDGDNLIVSFGEKTLFVDDGNLFSNNLWANPGIIYIGDLAGQTGILQFWLKSEGDPNLSILINNIAFTKYSKVGDLDGDMDVDIVDLGMLTSHWLEQDCNYPDWCEGADLDYSGHVNFVDLAIFAQNWLWEKIPADFDIDGDVDFVDYAVFTHHWMYQNCDEPDWCEGTDFDHSGQVDIFDLVEFAEYWLSGS